MNDWLKVMVPVLITAIGVMILNLYDDVKDIRDSQIRSKTWIYRIEQNEHKIKVLQEQQ